MTVKAITQSQKAWKMKIIENKPIDEIAEHLQYNNLTEAYKAIKDFSDTLRDPKTLLAYMKVDGSTHRDIAYFIQVPEQAVIEHLEKQRVLDDQVLYQLFFDTGRYSTIDEILEVTKYGKHKEFKENLEQIAESMEKKRTIWLNGIETGEARASLQYEIDRISVQEKNLKKRLKKVKQYRQDSETKLKRIEEIIEQTFKEMPCGS